MPNGPPPITIGKAPDSPTPEEVRHKGVASISRTASAESLPPIMESPGGEGFGSPELPPPETLHQQSFKDAFDRLENLKNPDRMNELLEIMQLLYEVLKTQRATATAMRNAERDLQLAELDNQITELRNAATTAFVMGFVSAGVSLGFLGLGVAGAAKDIKASIALSRAQKFQQTQQEFVLAKKEFNVIQRQVDQARSQLKSPMTVTERAQAQKNLASLEKQLDTAKTARDKTLAARDKAFERVQGDESARLMLRKDRLSEGSYMREKAIELAQSVKKLDMMNHIHSAVSSALQGTTAAAPQWIQAQAQVHQKEATRHEAKAQENEDWRQGMNQMISDIQQKLQSILQSYFETSRQILRA